MGGCQIYALGSLATRLATSRILSENVTMYLSCEFKIMACSKSLDSPADVLIQKIQVLLIHRYHLALRRSPLF